MTVIRNFGVAGVASTIEFGKQGGTLNYNNATKVFSFALSTALTIPAGTNSQRPTSGTLGMIRVNTESLPVLELYNGSTWTQVGGGGGGPGSVTSVSVISANGFTGTVANPSTTPEITLGTTVSGLLKGQSGTLVAASTTTDYQVPITLTTSGAYGAATFDGGTLNIPFLKSENMVEQIIAGTGISIESTSPSGTGAVTINANITSVANISGGAATQIAFQSNPSTTVFSPKFTWNDAGNTLTLGEFNTIGYLSGQNASGSFTAGSLYIKGGNASSGAAAGTLTVAGGNGLGGVQSGGNLILQGGAGGILGSGEIVLRTGPSASLIDRLRILKSGAWSVGNNDSFVGIPGQILTSQGPTLPPLWQDPTSLSGVTQIVAGAGITLDPGGGTGIVTINASGGSETPGGFNGELQWNNAGTFSGTSQIIYTSSDTLTIGSVNSTFTIAGIAGSGSRGANIVIRSGEQVAGGSSTRITIAGGNSAAAGVNGGSVFIDGGAGNASGTASGGTIFLRTTTGTTLVERLQIAPSGAIGIDGANYGSNGQVLTSRGPNLSPIWMAGGGGGGGSGVTLVNVSGGSTGLTTFGGPITSTGTITISGTLAVSNGGTGLPFVPGENGSLFFNNNNTYSEITGLKYDGATNLYFNSINISTEDNFDSFAATNPINIKPGTARNNTAFSANVNISGGDSLSTINRAGSVVLSGGVSSVPARSGYVILQTNNVARLTISETGAYGVPGTTGPSYGAAGQVLTSQGSSNPPIWQTMGGGTGSGVIAVTASAPLGSSGGNSPNITLSTVPALLGGTGFTSYTFGDILWANSASSLQRLNIGSAGQILGVVNGRPQWTSNISGVNSFSGGSTGLTPSTATSGIITLAGRLNIGFGGTGASAKTEAFNNLSPTQSTGDMIYFDPVIGNARLPIGAESNVLQVVSGYPTWAPAGLPQTAAGLRGRFLATEGITGTHATWSSQILFSGGNPSDTTRGRNITVQAVDGDPAVAAAGGSVFIRGGNNSDIGGAGGGNVQVQLGRDASSGHFIIRNFSDELFRVNRVGALSFGPTGTNTGNSGQILMSQGAGASPTWTTPSNGLPSQEGKTGTYLTTNGSTASWATLPVVVTKLIAGNPNVVLSPATGTGEVTISVVGSGFQGVTSFSAGSTGFSPSATTSGAVVLTGTLLTTSGGTGLTAYDIGDMLYASGANTLAKVGIGAAGTVLTSNGTAPTWTVVTGLPVQSPSTRGIFLASTGAGGAEWNSQVYWSNGPFGSLGGRNISLQATDGDTSYSGYPGGSVFIKAGNTGGANSGGGIIELEIGFDALAGYFVVKNPTTEFFRITRFGSWSLGSTGDNTGNSGQILTSQGPNGIPTWTDAGSGLPDQAGYAGYFLTTDGTSATWAVVSGGTGNPGGSTGQLQWNNGGAFAGTNQINYGGLNTLTLGNANTFNILGADSSDNNTIPGASLLIRGGQSGATSTAPSGIAGNVTIQGGTGKSSNPTGSGGAVYINGGTAPAVGGFVSIGTGATITERIRYLANGAWLVGGQTGTNGQALISTGASTPPEWKNVVQNLVAGSNIVITSSSTVGTLIVSATASPLSTATTVTIGGIKVGSGLSISADGTLSATGGGGSGAVNSVTGTNGIITSTSTGDIIVSGAIASTATIGLIKIGSGLSISSDGTLSVAPTQEKLELGFSITGLAGAGTVLLYCAGRSFIVPAGLINSYTRALSPATVNTTIQIFRSSAAGVISNIGLILFAAGQSTGNITFPSAITFGPGDVLYGLIAVADTTLGDIAITIAGTIN